MRSDPELVDRRAADSLFTDAGNRRRIGQACLAIDPGALTGSDVYDERVETLIAAMLGDPDVRLSGSGAARSPESPPRTASTSRRARSISCARSPDRIGAR